MGFYNAVDILPVPPDLIKSLNYSAGYDILIFVAKFNYVENIQHHFLFKLFFIQFRHSTKLIGQMIKIDAININFLTILEVITNNI